MKKIAIFNPEHDLCLANGDANYIPPQSALDFARQSANLMKYIYGDECLALPASEVKGDIIGDGDEIVAWGWNTTLVRQLIKQGVPRNLLPDEHSLEAIKMLSHRRTILHARQFLYTRHPEWPIIAAEELSDVRDVDCFVAKQGSVVLKAPWSGSGRGLRWVENELAEHDRAWLFKVLRSQGCVLAEQRVKVVQDFALEYFITDHKLHFVGYSLFESQNGVYRSNYLKSDEEIFTFLTKLVTEQSLIEAKHEIEIWLEIAVAARYEGPLGVDMYVYETAQGLCLNPLSEINFRHTMGHVAVALSQKKSTFASSKLSYNEIQQTGK